MEKVFASFGAAVFIILFLIITIVFAGTLNAYAIQLYWSWFIIPVFPLLLPLTLGKAYGFAMFVSLFTIHLSRYDHDLAQKEDKTEKMKGLIVKWLSTYAVIFVTGYIVHIIIG